MKKYAIKDIKDNIILTGRYTYKENADNSCNNYNKFYGSKRYEVIEIETNDKRMNVKDRAIYLFRNHTDLYCDTKNEIIEKLSNEEKKRNGIDYVVMLRITRRLAYLLPNNRKTNKSITPEEWHTKYFKCPYKCPYVDKNKQHVVCKTICMEAFVKGYTKGINVKKRNE